MRTVLLLDDFQKLIPEDAVGQVVPAVVHSRRDQVWNVVIVLLHERDEGLEGGDAFGVQCQAQKRHLVFNFAALRGHFQD